MHYRLDVRPGNIYVAMHAPFAARFSFSGMFSCHVDQADGTVRHLFRIDATWRDEETVLSVKAGFTPYADIAA